VKEKEVAVMSRLIVLSLAVLLVAGSGCAAVSDFLGRPAGEYRAERELKAYYLNKTAVTRGDVVDAKTGEVVFPAGTTVQVTDIRYRPNRYPKATGQVEIVGPGERKLKLGFASHFKEHLIMELGEVLAFNSPPPAETLPWRLGVAEDRAVRLAMLKDEFTGVPLWLVRDIACIEGSKQAYLPVGTEVELEDGSVQLTLGVDGERIVSRLILADGNGSRISLPLCAPSRTYGEWYDQMSEVVTTDEMTVAPDRLPAGASREAVLETWGDPDRRRGRMTNSGIEEEWNYALRGQTLVFVDGRLADK